MELLITWIVITVLTCILAKVKRRRVILWCFIGMLAGILGTIVLVFMPRGTVGLKKCLKCAEYVKQEAMVCKHCGADFYGVGHDRTIPRI